MATEEQTTENNQYNLLMTGTSSGGQKLTISARLISKLSFKLKRTGSPGGTVTYTIRKTDGTPGTLIASKLQGNANDISTTATWYEVTLDTPVSINEEVRILVKPSAGITSHFIGVRIQTSDVKASEQATVLNAGVWQNDAYDCAYIYTYTGGTTSAPSVTTQAASAVAVTTATGNGNVISLGAPPATLYGHCWATFPNPTTANSKTEGVPTATGAYTSAITGLLANTLYYCRAYITNILGTFYGAGVTFTTLVDVPAVTTDLCTSVATLTALGNGSIDNNGGSAVTQHGHCWSLTANPTTADSKTQNGTGVVGAFTSAITGLTANTLYHTRAYATNTTGTGYGADKTFTTLAVGVPTVTTEALTAIKPPTATGNGTIVDIGGSEVTEHGHCWGISPNPTTDNYKTTKGVGSVGAFTSAITGLTIGTIYYIRAYATNSYGTGYGNNVTIRGAMTPGNICVNEIWLAYIGNDAVERYVLGEVAE